MRTPAGKECKYFYGDYYRGRQTEECRLLKSHDLDWSPNLCSNCPIPDILLANACEHMDFQPRIERPLFVLRPRVEIETYCNNCQCDVEEPRVGCGLCHPLPQFIVSDPDEVDASE